MRKVFWALLLLTSYVWVVTTGHEQWVLDQGKRLFNLVSAWLNDAEVDFQVPQPSAESAKKKRLRRWD